MSEWIHDALPCHPQPYEDESLSGYLSRVATANGLPLMWALMQQGFPEWEYWQMRQVGWEYLADLGRLPQLTRQTIDKLQRLTVLPLLQKVYPTSMWQSAMRHQPGSYLRTIVKKNLAVCPLCLQERLYTRLLWRLQGVDICLEHRCQLQTACDRCGVELDVVKGNGKQCHNCHKALCELPIISEIVSEAIVRKQEDYRFLLNPLTSMVSIETCEEEKAQMIGLKLRQLRCEAGCSIQEMAKRIGVQRQVVRRIEDGRTISWPHCVNYLESLQSSWRVLAEMQTPKARLEGGRERRFVALRQCPNIDCANSRQVGHHDIWLIADLSQEGRARFRCLKCRTHFTRTLSGELTTRARKYCLKPGDEPLVPKSDSEIVQLKQLGLAGVTNREIARRLVWSEKTVRMYWVSLDMEAEVHAAQRERFEKERALKRQVLRDKVCELIASYGDQPISIRSLGRELDGCADFLHTQPWLMPEVRSKIDAHNVDLEKRKLQKMRQELELLTNTAVTKDCKWRIRDILQQFEMSYRRAITHYPELYREIKELVATKQMAVRAAQCAHDKTLIDAALLRLGQRKQHFNARTLSVEAGLSPDLPWYNKEIHDHIEVRMAEYAAGLG